MKPIAIHEGESSWNSRWIAFCRDNAISHKLVDCYASDIISRIRGCSGLMWHFSHTDPTGILMARHVLNSAEAMGLKVFPDFETNWHFDDKLAQKYLFEALELPTPAAWAFFDKAKALQFVEACELPIVAKLRRGAGSYNVRLLRTRGQARSYVRRMFGRGYQPIPAPLADARNKFIVAATSGGIHGVLKRLMKAPRFFREVLHGRKYFGNEKGYVLFQEFIPGNTCDIRVSVIGNRAWAFRRAVRAGDFRASGSGVIDYDVSGIPQDLIRRSFAAAESLKTQSVCYDWVQRADEFCFVEISYGFMDEAVYACRGHWDRDMSWHEGHMYPSIAIIEDFIGACSGGPAA
jgi:glutathione synthase/RimK-type ligase-like ATP-grasp enzyme